MKRIINTQAEFDAALVVASPRDEWHIRGNVILRGILLVRDGGSLEVHDGGSLIVYYDGLLLVHDGSSLHVYDGGGQINRQLTTNRQPAGRVGGSP